MRLFFELIQVSTGSRQCLSAVPDAAQWRRLFDMACRQTLTGVLYAGVERLPADQRPPRELLLQWFALAERIKAANRRLDAECVAVSAHFGSAGFDSVVLKGQGNARLYDVPQLRTPGDIDIWLGGGRRTILHHLQTVEGQTEQDILYHHTDFDWKKDVAVEVHFTPSWFSSYFLNRRLQRYFRRTAAEQFANRAELPDGAGRISVPTYRFNLLYLLLHIYRHLFGEGIGLRQLMDYYYLLRSRQPQEDDRKLLRHMGLGRFAAAMSWVMREVFALDAAHLPAVPDEREGRFLLDEVMRAGNFGKYDARNRGEAGRSRLGNFLYALRHNARFLSHYPGEVLWTPLFKIWHFGWRKWHGWT